MTSAQETGLAGRAGLEAQFRGQIEFPSASSAEGIAEMTHAVADLFLNPALPELHLI